MQGKVASTENSRKLDQLVKKVAKKINKEQSTTYFYEPGHVNNSTTIKLKEFIDHNLTSGQMPDGGFWFDKPWSEDDRKCKYVFEAKFQGNSGNAIQRWADGFAICLKLYPDVKYITFMSGTGCTSSGVLQKHKEKYECLYGDKVVFYLNQEGFTEDDIYEKMMKHLRE